MAARGETVLREADGRAQEITYRVFQAGAVVGVTEDAEFDHHRGVGGRAWGYRQCGDYFNSTDDAFRLGEEVDFEELLKAPQVDKFHEGKLNAFDRMRVDGFIVKIRVEWPDRSVHVSVEGKPFRVAPCTIPANVTSLRPWVLSDVDFCVVQLVEIDEVEPGSAQLPLPAWHIPVVSSADAAGPSGSSGATGGPAPQCVQGRPPLQQQQLDMPQQRKRPGKRRVGEADGDDFDHVQERAERRAEKEERAREDALAAAEDEYEDVARDVAHKDEDLAEEDQEEYERLREFYLTPQQKPRRDDERSRPGCEPSRRRTLRASTLFVSRARIEELKIFVNGRVLGENDEIDSHRFVTRLAMKLNVMHERGHRVWPLKALRVIAMYEVHNYLRAEPIPAWLRNMILGPDAPKVSHVIDLTGDDGDIPDGADVVDLLDESFASSLPPLPPEEIKLEDVLGNLEFD